MDTQILKLDAPYDYLYCNGEVGKHIATYIVGETKVGENGEYQLETHSHPIVQYGDSPRGIVWNRAELTDCEVLCNDTNKRVDVFTFNLLCIQRAEQLNDEANEKGEMLRFEAGAEADLLKTKLKQLGIGFKVDEGDELFYLAVEVNKCHEGYYALSMDPCFCNFDIIAKTLDELAKMLTEEREGWEEFYDHVIMIKYSPESTMATGFVESL